MDFSPYSTVTLVAPLVIAPMAAVVEVAPAVEAKPAKTLCNSKSQGFMRLL